MAAKNSKTKSTKEKFDYKQIKSFEDACNKLGIDPNHLPDVSLLPDDTKKAIIAHYKLIIIYKAINNGWVPNWKNSNQYKYYPWFYMLASGFGFSDSHYSFTSSTAYVGSRLCGSSSEQALYIAKQFEAEYIDFFTNK